MEINRIWEMEWDNEYFWNYPCFAMDENRISKRGVVYAWKARTTHNNHRGVEGDMHRGLKIVSSFLFAFVLLAQSAAMASVVYNFDDFYTGTPPGGTTPWLTATFQDQPLGKVLLTLSTANLVGHEFVTEWAFNFNTAKNASKLHFSKLSGDAFSDVDVYANHTHAGDIHTFDFDIKYPSASNKRFGPNEIATILISSNVALAASDFDFATLSNGEQYYAAAHIQGITLSRNCDEGSAWVGTVGDPPVHTPEPGTMVLMSIGVLGAAFLRKRGNKAAL